MVHLTLAGTSEDGKRLLLVSDAGEEYTLDVDARLRSALRGETSRLGQLEITMESVLRPRDIQARIRAGETPEAVAEAAQTSVEKIMPFAGPVLAEREHIVGQALAVPVLISGELDPDAQPTFGSAVRAKLAEAGAVGERWTSWREQTGWIVKLTFVVGEVDRDARWSLDPRRSVLSPLNADATQLSRQGSLPEGLIPRLRALDVPGMKDDTRFDSGAFGPRRLDIEDEPGVEATGPVAPAVQAAAIKRAPDATVTSSETADLLEALRRRRGQREPLPGPVEAREPEPRTPSAPVALFDALEPGYRADDPETEPDPERTTAPPASSDGGRRTKGRPSMPSWDEIVFGARTDES